MRYIWVKGSCVERVVLNKDAIHTPFLRHNFVICKWIDTIFDQKIAHIDSGQHTGVAVTSVEKLVCFNKKVKNPSTSCIC